MSRGWILPNTKLERDESRFWGQITQKLSGLSPKRDCGSERVKIPISNYPRVSYHRFISYHTCAKNFTVDG